MNGPRNGDPPLLLDRPDDIRELRRSLDDAGYTHAGVMETLGPGDLAVDPRDTLVCAWRTREQTPRNALIRLFLLDASVPVDSARRLLSPRTVALFLEAGLVELRDDRLAAPIKLLPYHGDLFAFDARTKLMSGDPGDYVMGIGKSTLMLCNMTVRRPSRLSLDLGCGCGFQATMASRHSERVIASDLNPRAVRLARFNGLLNGLTNLECVAGDLFQPVAGRLFDLIVSNPPFVISPEKKYAYRDSGLEGDAVCRKIVREVPDRLAEGGLCQILCNWVVRKGEDWRKNLEEWFRGTGCDAWVLMSEKMAAENYASTWIRHTELRDIGRHVQQFEEWITHYQGIGIESVCFGFIMMRKRAGAANWYRAEVSPEKILGECGDDVVRGFAVRDFLESAPTGEDILSRAYVPSPSLAIDSCHSISGDGWVEGTPRIRLTQGIAHEGNIDKVVASIITRCDGERPLRQILDDVASRFGVAPSSLTTEACEIVRGLVEKGYLWLAGPRDQAKDASEAG